jgi:hypothetical protein
VNGCASLPFIHVGALAASPVESKVKMQFSYTPLVISTALGVTLPFASSLKECIASSGVGVEVRVAFVHGGISCVFGKHA